jgi:hypothetical protein
MPFVTGGKIIAEVIEMRGIVGDVTVEDVFQAVSLSEELSGTS